jgi:hypothetical protein
MMILSGPQEVFMKKLFMILSLTALSTPLWAQELKDSFVQADTRYDNLPSTDVSRLQERVRVGFTVDAYGLFEMVGILATGPSFGNDWATVVSNGSKNDVTLAFRNIYLRKTFKQGSVELGALDPEPTVGAAALGSSGWVDGVKVKLHTEIGDFKVIAGSLGDFQESNAFKRDFEGNFIEIEMTKKLFDQIMTQTAYENLNGQNYVRENVSYDLKLFGDKVFKLVGNALYNINQGKTNFDVGVEFDLLHTILDKYEHRLDLKIYYSNLEDSMTDRGDMIPAFFTYGTRTSIQLGGKIDKAGHYNWFARASMGESSRFDVGVAIKFNQPKKPKRK